MFSLGLMIVVGMFLTVAGASVCEDPNESGIFTQVFVISDLTGC